MKPQSVLVTGANGFLGSHIVHGLIRRGYRVGAAMRACSDPWRMKDVEKRIEAVEMDLLLADSVSRVLKRLKPKAVIHCAAYGVNYNEQDFKTAYAVNLHGTYDLMCAAHEAGVSRFVHLGSCFEYGTKSEPIKEDALLEPTSLYGASKAAGTLLALAWSQQKRLPLAVVRPFGLWGPMEAAHRLVPLIISHCQNKSPLKLTAGEQIRDYLYVSDAAEMIIDLLETNRFPDGEILNLGGGVPIRLKDFVLKIASVLNAEPLMRFGEIAYRPTEMWRLVADIEKWEALVGPLRQTPLSVGIKKTLENFGEGHETD